MQLCDESASDFVLRLLDLRERTKLSSSSTSKGLEYPSQLVDQMFKQALTTGFRDVEMRIRVQELMAKS